MAKFLKLEDVEKTARENPETFFIPSVKERKSQRVGDSVRLHFNDDPKNVRLVEVGYMLSLDPSLAQPLEADVGAVFERMSRDEPWKRITDWTPPE